MAASGSQEPSFLVALFLSSPLSYAYVAISRSLMPCSRFLVPYCSSVFDILSAQVRSTSRAYRSRRCAIALEQATLCNRATPEKRALRATTENRALSPRTQNRALGPRTQNRALSPRTQNRALSPRTKNRALSPRTENRALRPRTQNRARSPRTKKRGLHREPTARARLQQASVRTTYFETLERDAISSIF